MDNNVDLLQWLASFFDKKTSGGAVKNEIKSNIESDIFQKIDRLSKKLEKRKKHSSFLNIVWGADVADMSLISKVNK